MYVYQFAIKEDKNSKATKYMLLVSVAGNQLIDCVLKLNMEFPTAQIFNVLRISFDDYNKTHAKIVSVLYCYEDGIFVDESNTQIYKRDLT